MKHIILLLTLAFTVNLYSQGNVGIGTPFPNASSMLDITSNNKGLLIPRMNNTAMMGITNPANGLMIYDTVFNLIFTNTGTPASPDWKPILNVKYGWSTVGNDVDNNAFLGTTNAKPLKIKVDEQEAGYIHNNNGSVYLGIYAGIAAATSIIDTAKNNIGIGRRALNNNLTKHNLIAIGDSALMSNGVGSLVPIHSSSNTAIGSKALKANTIGYSNVALGNTALVKNTVGNYNVAIGHNTMASNQEGLINTAVGFNAMADNNDGGYNVAVGGEALLLNQTGDSNVGVGYHAGYGIRGNNNVAIGSVSQRDASNGKYNNVAVGDSTLMKIGLDTPASIVGNNNTAIGAKSMYAQKSGNGNTALGAYTMRNDSSGLFYNTAVGFEAMKDAKGGAKNSAFGAYSTVGDDVYESTAIGVRAKVESDNSLVLGGIAGVNGALFNTKVGIGTTTPDVALHIAGGRDLLVGDSMQGAGTKMMFVASKGAFRAGSIQNFNSAFWNTDSIGLYSFAGGYNTKANGDNGATAIGYFSKASGYYGATALGGGTTASGGFGATAIGYFSEAIGYYGATALGYLTKATGDFGATALGTSTIASGNNGATAFGSSTRASGFQGATALGMNTIASGDSGATALGYGTIAKSISEIVVGINNDTTTYFSPPTANLWVPTDRIFSVGNGDFASRSNALTILKNGRIGIGTTLPTNLLQLSTTSGTSNGMQLMLDESSTGYNRMGFSNFGVLGWTLGATRNATAANSQFNIYSNQLNADVLSLRGDGTACFYGDVKANVVTTCSDQRYKTKITPIISALDKVMHIDAVSYHYKTDEYKDKHLPQGEQVGFIAQNLEQYLPQVVHTDADGYKSVDYAKVTPLLLAALKELKEENDKLKVKNESLAKSNNSLSSRLDNIEAILLNTTAQK